MIHYRIAYGKKYLGCPGTGSNYYSLTSGQKTDANIILVDGSEAMINIQMFSQFWSPAGSNNFNPKPKPSSTYQWFGDISYRNWLASPTGSSIASSNLLNLKGLNIYFNDVSNITKSLYIYPGSDTSIDKALWITCGIKDNALLRVIVSVPDADEEYGEILIQLDSNTLYDATRNIRVSMYPYVEYPSMQHHIYCSLLVPTILYGDKWVYKTANMDFPQGLGYSSDLNVQFFNSAFFNLDSVIYLTNGTNGITVEEILR